MSRLQRVRSWDEIPVDIFTAIKRGFIKRGIFPGGGEKSVSKTRTAEIATTDEKGTGGLNEAATTALQEKQNLEGLSNQSNEMLFKASSVFPFILFPDIFILDRVKVTIITRTFFQSAQVISSPIEDILSAEAIVGPFFGTLKISSRYFTTNMRMVKYLKRHDAIHVQRLLQGYIIARERRIDCNKISTDKLLELLENLGEEATKENF